MHKTPEEKAMHQETRGELTREHVDQELLEELGAAAIVIKRHDLLDEFNKTLLAVHAGTLSIINLSNESIGGRNDD